MKQLKKKVIEELKGNLEYTESHDIPFYLPPSNEQIKDKINEIIKVLNNL